MAEELDITLEYERIAEALEEIAPFSELAEDTLRLLIVRTRYKDGMKITMPSAPWEKKNAELKGQDDE